MNVDSERSTVTRYALRTVGTEVYVFALARYTMPAATENKAEARTWASARGALVAARRAGLTTVEVVAVQRDAADF